MDNLQKAYSIIENAEKRAEELFQKAVNETLPRQLKDIPTEEHLEFYRRKSKELREWRKDHYQPYFDLEQYGRDRIAGMIRVLLDDADRGKEIKWFRDTNHREDTIMVLAKRIMTVKYIRYLKGIIDDPPPKRNPGLPDQLAELNLTEMEEKALAILWGSSDPVEVKIFDGDQYREWLTGKLKYHSADVKRAFIAASIEYLSKEDNNYFGIIQALRAELNDQTTTPGKLEWALKNKTDLIRLLVALHDIHAFGVATQSEVMEEFSRFLNVDLSNYDQLLSKAMSGTPLEKNVEFFEKLKKKIQNRKLK